MEPQQLGTQAPHIHIIEERNKENLLVETLLCTAGYSKRVNYIALMV